MKTTILIFLFLFTLLNANDLKKAKEFEKDGKYKEANLLYKKLLKNDYYNEKQLNYFDSLLDKSDDEETNFTITQVFRSEFKIYPYKDNYFLPISYDLKNRKNRKQNEAKFQISFKKPISYDFFNLNETINIAYTQTSFWQIYDTSAPFRETNYKPEIFIFIPYKKLDHTSLKAYKISLMHESNGRNNEYSRSWNRIYLEGFFQIKEYFMAAKAWARFPDKKDDNKDIYKYYGYGEIELAKVYKENIFKLKLRNNLRLNRDNKGYVELNYSFAFKKNFFSYFQISSGYGDSLIDYDKEVNRISIGISLSR